MRDLSSVSEIAAAQHGIITCSQLEAAGCTPRVLRRLTGDGSVRRVRRGVYVIAGAPRSWEQSLLAAVMSCGESAVASHWSAALLHAMPNTGPMPHEMTVPRRRQPGRRARGVHRTLVLDDLDITELRGVPVTSYERTLCDLTARWNRHQLARALDEGIRSGRASVDRLRLTIRRLESGPGRRPAVINELIAERRGLNPLESGAERRLLELIRSVGLPEPANQVQVAARGRQMRLDFAYLEARVAIEFDGFQPHSTRTAFVRDRRRVTDLGLMGWKVLVFTAESADVEVVDSIARALALDPGPHLARLHDAA